MAKQEESSNTELPVLVSSKLIDAIPDIKKIQALEALRPGITDRFLDLIDEEGKHRRATEAQAAINDEKKEKRYHTRRVLAMVFGLFMGISALLICGYIMIHVDQWSAQVGSGLLGGGGVFALVKVFMDFER